MSEIALWSPMQQSGILAIQPGDEMKDGTNLYLGYLWTDQISFLVISRGTDEEPYWKAVEKENYGQLH